MKIEQRRQTSSLSSSRSNQEYGAFIEHRFQFPNESTLQKREEERIVTGFRKFEG